MDHTTTTSPYVAVSTTDAPAPTSGRSLRRRGLVAGAAALVAALAVAQPARAAQLVGTNGTWNGAPDSNPDGVQGYTTGASNAGVFGRNNDLNGLGVSGAAPSGIGVAGSSGNGPGVSGISTSNYGVYGTSTSGNGTGGVSGTGYGLLGIATGTGGYGLVAYPQGSGYAASFNGEVLVNGTQYVIPPAGTGTGLVGYSNTSGYWGLGAIGNMAGANGLYAAPGAGGTAGYFGGNVVVTGSLTVYGSYPKNAAVPHPDGSHRLLYCTEAPEPWFEDFGVANLTGGKATVTLDPDFAAVAVTSGYHVFLTPEADCNGLYVTGKTATGFTVQELRGGTSTLSFSWRIAARRGDIAGNRFATFSPPLGGAIPPPPAPLTLSPDLPPAATPPQAPPAIPLKPGPPVAPVIPAQTATVVAMPGPTATAAAVATTPSTATVTAPTVPSTAAPTTVPATGTTPPVVTAVPRLTAAPTGATATSVPMATTTTSTSATTGIGSTATGPALTATPRPSGTAGSAASATATTGTGTTSTGTAGTVPNATPAPH